MLSDRCWSYRLSDGGNKLRTGGFAEKRVSEGLSAFAFAQAKPLSFVFGSMTAWIYHSRRIFEQFKKLRRFYVKKGRRRFNRERSDDTAKPA